MASQWAVSLSDRIAAGTEPPCVSPTSNAAKQVEDMIVKSGWHNKWERAVAADGILYYAARKQKDQDAMRRLEGENKDKFLQDNRILLAHIEQIEKSQNSPVRQDCSTLARSMYLGPRTHLVAADMIDTSELNGWDNGICPPAMAAACVFAASHITGTRERPFLVACRENIGDCTMMEFRYAYLWLHYKRHELMTEQMRGYGADVEKLPDPLSAVA